MPLTIGSMRCYIVLLLIQKCICFLGTTSPIVVDFSNFSFVSETLTPINFSRLISEISKNRFCPNVCSSTLSFFNFLQIYFALSKVP